MARYKLLAPEASIPYSKIVSGRKWVGRVYPKSDGTFGAVLGAGPHVSAATRVEAFELVVAKSCGFDSVNALEAHNSAVRSVNRQRRADARAFMNDFLNGSGTLEQKIDSLNKVLGL